LNVERRHRLLYLTSDLGGGTGNHLLSMLAHLDSARWHAEILTETQVRARVEPTVPVQQLSEPGIDQYPFAQVLRLRRVARACRDRQPDLVHAYFFWTILYARLLKLAGRIPVLVENREDQGFNWGVHEYAWLRLTRRAPDRIVCVSDAVRRTVAEREGLPAGRLTVIRNGIAAPRRRPARQEARAELGLAPDDLVVGMIANFDRAAKGVDRFVEAIRPVVEAVPAARFLLVGRGKNEAAVREQAHRLGVDDRLVFAGFRSDVEVAYAAMDLSVLTSRTEGLSITLLESMDQGLPAVVTDVGGNPEVVVQGETGLLVPPEDTDAFARAVVQLLRTPEMRRRMGEAARRRVEAEFRIDRTADRYAALYEELLSAPR
jgi:glycosyltransferase involved in cell wall biosynthesis